LLKLRAGQSRLGAGQIQLGWDLRSSLQQAEKVLYRLRLRLKLEELFLLVLTGFFHSWLLNSLPISFGMSRAWKMNLFTIAFVDVEDAAEADTSHARYTELFFSCSLLVNKSGNPSNGSDSIQRSKLCPRNHANQSLHR